MQILHIFNWKMIRSDNKSHFWCKHIANYVTAISMTAFIPPFTCYTSVYAGSVALPFYLILVLNSSTSFTVRAHRILVLGILSTYMFWWYYVYMVSRGLIEKMNFFPTFFVSYFFSNVLMEITVTQWND